jgi:prevent-host-death family protein
MREVGVLEAKTHLSALLDSVERSGEPVVITRNGRPVAKLSPANDASLMPRKASAAELAARSKALRDRIAAARPESEKLTWEELKQLARE